MDRERISRALAALWLGVSVPLLGLSAQPPSDLAERAGEHYQAQRWAEAAALYRELVQQQAGDARAWYRLGVSLRHLGKHAESIEALSRARSAGTPVQFVAPEVAKAQVALGRSEAALASLEQAVNAGYSASQALEDDAELAGLKDEPRFAAAVAKARANQYPCESRPAFRAFDFWAGDWDVHTPDGQFAGTNAIEVEEHGCVLVERWRSANGGTGMSMNYYDPGKDKWVQQWVSEGGLLIEIEGGLDEKGAMVLSGHAYYVATDVRAPFRGTWTPMDDGRVRQYFEQSNDGGETWSPWFDGYYSRRTAAD